MLCKLIRGLLKTCIGLVILLMLVQMACRSKLRFPSPDGRAAAVLVIKPGFADSHYELALEVGWFGTGWLAPGQGDCLLQFAHAAWTPDSQRVAFYKRDAMCEPVWLVYDRSRKIYLPFDSMADIMRESVRQAYQLKDDDLREWGGDPLRWMQGPGPVNYGPDPAAAALSNR